MSKFLEFKKDEDEMVVLNKKDQTVLGVIMFYPQWKKYVFVPTKNTVFEDGCLTDIIRQVRIGNQIRR